MALSSGIDFDALISERARQLDVSGIRRVFELGAKLRDPIDLSIGQPDFPVPPAIKQAAKAAIDADRNGYTLTQGTADLRAAIARHLRSDLGWDVEAPSGPGLLVTSGTSGAIMLACLALLDQGDEVVVADPYFVIYPALPAICGARAVLCDTYPDFRLTAERVRPLLTKRTKMVIVNSPSNPCGVALGGRELRDLAELCESRGVLLLSDEIYDTFTFASAREDGRCPSPARLSEQVLVVRGFGKSYGCTGWRLGYAAGPRAVIAQMTKLQQYTFVCAPSTAQAACARAFEVDMSEQVRTFERRRDLVVEAFEGVASLVSPGGAFYAFVEVPLRLGLSASQFVERAIERNVLIIPGKVFSRRDSHFRLSYAVPDAKLRQGVAILRALM